ncbi:flavodoxin family protein [Thermosyntropha sp.]|uniref:flavodoxin family protein n=1 Tax=Thermosyntropha sp. TaxID=2740820 RepID=UPI0025FF83C6|nr:flavodoxin family protein [Thermosyntropha sp.]MBO8158661.1 flavodoxin family protein [Thermosyntropha sp.]
MSELLIVAINGSPNREGNTALLLHKAAEECEKMGAKVEFIHCQQVLKDMTNPFCVACSSPCSGRCFKDKVLEKTLKLISKADGIIMGSPVYFGTVSAQLKAFWDKTRGLRNDKKLLNVVGGAIAVGASRFGGQETTIRAMQDMMMVQGMIIVGDGYYEDDCGHLGAAAQRPSSEDENALLRASIVGKRIVEVAKATKHLRKR